MKSGRSDPSAHSHLFFLNYASISTAITAITPITPK